jgi:NADPH-dependent curcumin reductase CurA
MAQLCRQGRIRSIDNVVTGFENTPGALRDMLTGASTGKTLVRYAIAKQQAST